MKIIVTKRGNIFKMGERKILASDVNIEEGNIAKIRPEGLEKIKGNFAM